MKNKLTIHDFIQSHGERLDLHWQAGQKGEKHLLQDKNQSSHPIVGYLNLVRPNRIQVLGLEEIQYLKQLGKNSHKDTLSRLFANKPAMLIFSNCENKSAIDSEYIDMANQTGCPLFYSRLDDENIVDQLQYHLGRLLGDSQILHGVFMEVMGIGVLLTGPSGIGKSELALELLSRGHRLIADDAPEFRRSAPETIHGRCPIVLKDFLEVRGLGVLNIRAMFGDTSIVETKRLRLIVNLNSMSKKEEWEIDRIGESRHSQTILDVEVPKVLLPVAPGRNLAVIIEAAVRNHVLYLNGYNASADFITRQQKIISSE